MTPQLEPAQLESALAALAEPAPAAVSERVAAALGLGDEYVTVDGPVGPLRVAYSDRGISLVDAAAGNEAAFRAAFAARFGGRPLRRAASGPPPGLVAALEGRRVQPRAAGLGYDLSACSPFQRAVLAKTAEIPRGEVRSYGWVAREIGHGAAVRAVGTALGRNPVPVLIPCHRVVRSDGRIGNYALGSSVKTRLLRTEGVDVVELTRLATAGVRYVGNATTHVFCVPTCRAARLAEGANRVTFRSAADARRRGYRPCQSCRPSTA